MSNSDNPLFSHHEHALEKAYEVCPECGCELTIKNGKSGAFLGCSAYPSCEYTRPVVEHERIEDKILVGTHCPLCSNPLAVKQGRYGMFIGCSNYPDCHHIEHQTNEQQTVECPQCNHGQLAQRVSRYGETFYACNDYPKCKYVVNYQPLNESCPECGWGILIEKKNSAGTKIQCPQKKCHYKTTRA